MRVTALELSSEIRQKYKKMGFHDDAICEIIKAILLSEGYNESHIRRIIPHELKNQSKTNIRYRRPE